MIAGLVAGLGAAVLFGGGAVLQAHAIRRRHDPNAGLVHFVLASIRDPWTMSVIVAYLAGFLLHVVAIWWLPLYLAQATIAVSLPITAVASAALDERLSTFHWLAIVVVTTGLVLLALGSGEPGAAFLSPWFAIGGWLGVVLLAAAARFAGGWSGFWLGTLAGLGYAGSAIAVRGATSDLTALSVATALTVPAYGLVAFWLYSNAMTRASVSSATAPMIVVQTFVPALIGVALLDDGVRAEWWPGVAAGLILATVGAVALSKSPTSATQASESAPDPAR